jgi:CheY-like chemotaxis protein
MQARFDQQTTGAAAGAVGIPPRTHILIIDDHAPSRALCADYCDLFDHASEGVADAAEAVAALGRAPFGVVLLNLQMPTAPAAVRAIRALPGRAGLTPIIGLAGADQPGWRFAGLAAVIAKPVTAAQLFAALGATLACIADEPRSWSPFAF